LRAVWRCNIHWLPFGRELERSIGCSAGGSSSLVPCCSCQSLRASRSAQLGTTLVSTNTTLVLGSVGGWCRSNHLFNESRSYVWPVVHTTTGSTMISCVIGQRRYPGDSVLRLRRADHEHNSMVLNAAAHASDVVARDATSRDGLFRGVIVFLCLRPSQLRRSSMRPVTVMHW